MCICVCTCVCTHVCVGLRPEVDAGKLSLLLSRLFTEVVSSYMANLTTQLALSLPSNVGIVATVPIWHSPGFWVSELQSSQASVLTVDPSP